MRIGTKFEKFEGDKPEDRLRVPLSRRDVVPDVTVINHRDSE